MKTLNKFLRVAMASLFCVALAGLTIQKLPQAQATGSMVGAPDQASCDSGSTNFTWNGMNIARPIIATLSVDGETVSDPTNPTDGSIGAAICPNVELGRRTGLFVYEKNGMSNDMDLSNAVTPQTQSPITSNSEITITLTNMGDLAQYYSFALVHGNVTHWETAHLGTPQASLSVTMKPVRTPFGNGEQFGGCTATPPHCSATQSDADAVSASMDMTFDQNGYGNSFRGSYFGLTGAMGGWVQADGSLGSTRLHASIGGPHFLADGQTPNVGSLQAFLPDDVVQNLFGMSASDLDTDSLSVTRTEDDDTTTAPFQVSQVSGGILVSMDNVTFSSPTYNISLAGDSGGGSDLPQDSDTSKSLSLGNNQFVNLSSPDGTVITDFHTVALSGLPVSDLGHTYPLGLYGYSLTVPTGSTQSMELHYLTDLTPSQVTPRKYNSTTHTFSTIPGAQLSEDDFNGQHVLDLSYDIKDGGPLDEDGVANGVIVDPIGLATTTVGVPNTGLGGTF